MEDYKISIITEHDLAGRPDVAEEGRFALALAAGIDPLEHSAASSIRLLPSSVQMLLEPVEALSFMTWARFAGRHYGTVICACAAPIASAVRGLLGLTSEPRVPVHTDADRAFEDAVRLGAVLSPLVGTQYTAIEEFRLLIAELRQKCPWDRQQTHTSLLDTLLEESYEVALAIQRGNIANLEEELGDLLLQVFIQSEIASEEDDFDVNDVIRTIDDKLTFRHPHVFGSVAVDSADQVLVNWQKLKSMEGRKKHFVDSAKLLSSIENALLAQETARLDGFDFESADQAYGKLLEECEELGDEMKSLPQREEALEMELGDVLFSALNVARLSSINPVKALRHSFTKFRDRYQRVCEYAAQQQIDMSTASQEDLDHLWQLAKNA
ncbi:MAG: nucleoside triphosphate pyrophosphohydrolase [Candidatus Cryosericum sp.]